MISYLPGAGVFNIVTYYRGCNVHFIFRLVSIEARARISCRSKNNAIVIRIAMLSLMLGRRHMCFNDNSCNYGMIYVN